MSHPLAVSHPLKHVNNLKINCLYVSDLHPLSRDLMSHAKVEDFARARSA